MITFIGLIIVLIVGILVLRYTYQEELGAALLVLSFVGLLFVFIVGAANFLGTNYKTEEREALIISIEAVTTDGEFEHLSLDQEIIDFNKELLLYKKQIKNPFINFGMSKKVLDVEPITNYRP